MSLHTAPPENSVHYLVLTDMAGNKSYACCITFSRKFVAEKDDQGYLYMSLETDKHTDTCTDKLSVYIPHCCITISQYPYYTKMKECLSSLVSCINKDPEELYIFLKEYSHILMNTPVPPAGNVAVELNLNQLPVILKPTSHPDKPVLDLPLHLIFLYFNIEEFMKILVYILQEERLVFLANNYSLLTVIMESVRYLILPFEWRFTYVTVLPSNGLGYLQAPGTFMFGCHSDHKYEVEQIDGLVLVDINLGEVTLNPDTTTTVNDKLGTVPCLPADAARLFVEASQKFRLLIDSEFLQRPCFHNFEELKQFQAKKESEINEVITQGCLELMVNLFRSVIPNIRVEQRYFNKEQFLNQYFGTDRTFYEKVLTTDMFKKFLEDRMNEKKDYWSDLERKTRETLRRGSVQIPTRLSELLYNRRPSSTLLVKKEMRVFNLPDVTNTKHYVEYCCKTLTSKIQECPDYDERMSYIYLRAMFNMAANNNMAALEDFITLSSSFTRILPTKHLVDAYNRLSSVEKAQFVKKPGHEGLLDIIEATESADEQTEHRGQKIRMDPIPMPESDLKYEEFKEYITLQNMSEDFETIKRLFEALTINSKNQSVDQTTLTLCVEHWINNRNQCDHVKFDEDRLQEEEIILKMSDLIKTDFGLGRIGLTDKRLFFLVNVTNKYSEIAKLQDIVKLEKSQYYGIFRGIDILIIHKKDNTVFTANLKEERNWWYLLIYEMWAGRKVFVEAKDIMALQLAAQNTLLMDAVIASGQDDLTVHSTCPSEAASRLGYYSQYVDKGKHVLSGDTKQKLQTKIDPNIGEHDRKTIQALLYTGGDDCAVPPKLWCGLSDGKIKVYNASTWMLEGNPIQTKQSVACLTAVDDDHVWAGSYGIYIISTETITCTKTLMEHQDLVVDIVPYDNNKYVFSASLEGTIIKWDVKKLTRETIVNLQSHVKCLRSLKIYDDKMFCGSWSSILMCNMRGEIIRQFQSKEGNKIKELDSFIILPSGEMLTGCRRESLIFVWNIDKKEQEGEIKLSEECRGVSVMSQTHNQVWVGSKEGIIRTFDMKTKQMLSTLQVHEDAVRVLCPVTDRYMVSGGGSMDGKVCMWSLLAHSTDSGQFMDTLEENPSHFGP